MWIEKEDSEIDRVADRIGNILKVRFRGLCCLSDACTEPPSSNSRLRRPFDTNLP
jgi:hypothetical protein